MSRPVAYAVAQPEENFWLSNASAPPLVEAQVISSSSPQQPTSYNNNIPTAQVVSSSSSSEALPTKPTSYEGAYPPATVQYSASPAPHKETNNGYNSLFADDSTPYATTNSTTPYNFDYSQYGSSSTQYDRAYFANYDKLNRQLQELAHVESATTKVLAEISKSEFNINKVQHKLNKEKHDQAKLEKRIQRNEHPRFLHYMQFNREDKVKRLKQEHKDLMAAERKAEGEIEVFTATLGEAKRRLNELQRMKREKDGLAATRVQLFDSVVASTPPTARLRQIDDNLNTQQREINKENSLLSQIDQVIAIVRTARRLYGQSLDLLQRAARLNTGAAITNFGRGRGMEMVETMQQANRDKLINQSQEPATRGGVEMERAWSIFPQEARRRHPALCSQIGRAPLPKLRGARFGGTMAVKFIAGDFGDAMNGAHAARKIRENMQIVSSCVGIVDNQLNLVIALRQGVIANIGQMDSVLKTLESQKQQERQVIFNSVRQRAA